MERSLFTVSQHGEREKGEGYALHYHARAHQFIAVFFVEFAALRHGHHARDQNGQNKKHGNDGGGEKES